MTTIRLDYVDRFRDRHGRERFYYRRQGRRFPLPCRPGEAAFMDAYAAAAAQFEDDEKPPLTKHAAGTFDALAAHFYSSTDYKALTESTRRTHRSTIDRFREESGKSRVAHLNRPHVKKLIAKWYDEKGVAPANKLLKMIRLLMKQAIELGWRKDDPTLGLKLIPPEGDGFADWSEADIAKFEKRWKSGSRQRLALYLALFTGQRRSDIVRMGRQHVRGDAIEVRQQKTGARLLIPLHPTLKAELDAQPKEHLTFIVTAHGAPFSVAGLGNWFSDAARDAGLKDRSLHGLRKSAARRSARPIVQVSVRSTRTDSRCSLWTSVCGGNRIFDCGELSHAESKPSGRAT